MSAPETVWWSVHQATDGSWYLIMPGGDVGVSGFLTNQDALAWLNSHLTEIRRLNMEFNAEQAEVARREEMERQAMAAIILEQRGEEPPKPS